MKTAMDEHQEARIRRIAAEEGEYRDFEVVPMLRLLLETVDALRVSLKASEDSCNQTALAWSDAQDALDQLREVLS